RRRGRGVGGRGRRAAGGEESHDGDERDEQTGYAARSHAEAPISAVVPKLTARARPIRRPRSPVGGADRWRTNETGPKRNGPDRNCLKRKSIRPKMAVTVGFEPIAPMSTSIRNPGIVRIQSGRRPDSISRVAL